MTFAPGGARSEDGDPFATAESNALWCFFSLALDEVGGERPLNRFEALSHFVPAS
jgi:hypothetical protein